MSLAIVFPGQGSQSVGMLAELAAADPVVGETFAEASAVLGYDLWALTQDGPEADLNDTTRTQPALLTAGVAVARVWRGQGGAAPLLMAGHSLGEYAALVAAGAIPFAAAVDLVQARGVAMQAAVPPGAGAMAAILGLDDDAVRAACAAVAGDEVVAAVNLNAPGQVVIAGHASAVERAIEACKGAGAKRAIPLPVSVPSHCALMLPAAERMRERLASAEISSPIIPVIHNADVTVHADPDGIRAALVAQLSGPVRWVETIRAMADRGVTTVAEFGPGKVLTGLMRRIDRGIEAKAVFDPASLGAMIEREQP
jgi:[acyl-carrier-protein] S-malonyltransferase